MPSFNPHAVEVKPRTIVCRHKFFNPDRAGQEFECGLYPADDTVSSWKGISLTENFIRQFEGSPMTIGDVTFMPTAFMLSRAAMFAAFTDVCEGDNEDERWDELQVIAAMFLNPYLPTQLDEALAAERGERSDPLASPSSRQPQKKTGRRQTS